MGINAAAIVDTPLSVARRLNCAAAFLVFCTSTRIPSPLILRLVASESGYIEAPSPRISKSVSKYISAIDPKAQSNR